MAAARFLRYTFPMDPRTGTVVNGRIVLDDGDGLVEGARVTVLLDDDATDAPVTVEAAELQAIDDGRVDVARGDLLDARTFLAELRRDG